MGFDLAAWLLGALSSLPVYKEDRAPELEREKSAQYAELASSIAAYSVNRPRSPREWAALTATIGYHESGFSLRIQRGGCKPLECDRGRARGPFQQQKNLYTRAVWPYLVGQEHGAVQARVAAEHLERSYWVCARSGVDWLTGTINAYAGRRCNEQWRGLQERVRTFNILIRYQPKGVAIDESRK